jgi:hypothetical protein
MTPSHSHPAATAYADRQTGLAAMQARAKKVTTLDLR